MPCPACGGRAIIDLPLTDQWTVWCEDCPLPDLLRCFPTARAAIRAWNTRAPAKEPLMRDSGWMGVRRRIAADHGRTSITLRTWGDDGGWDVFGGIDMAHDSTPPDQARAAAEDALRQFCKDTLAALEAK